MRIAITGATGFVGGRLAQRLATEGIDIAALVRAPERAARLRDLGVTLVEGDLTDPAAARRLAEGADALFHVAGWYRLGARDAAEARRVNVEGTRVVLAAMRQAGVPKGVYTSTLAVNSDTGGVVVDETYRFTGRHLSVYDETKAAAHDLAEREARAGLPLVIVMPGLVYGPGDTSQTGAMLRDVVLGRRPVVPAGGRVCWGYVDDIVDGHVRALGAGTAGQAYMLAGPPHPLADGLRAAARLAGTRGPIVVPTRAVRAAAAAVAVVERVAPLPATFRSESLRAGCATYLGNPGKAARALGWSARPLAEGMAETVAALRVQPGHGRG